MKKQEEIDLEVVEYVDSKEPLASAPEEGGEATSVASRDAADSVAADAADNKTDAAQPAEATAETVVKKKRKKKKTTVKEKPLAEMTFWEQMKAYADSDDDAPMSFNFRAMLGGEGLPRFFRRNWLFISIIVFFTCCYVTSRYMMQTAVLENRALTDTLLDRRYKALTINSELLERTLSSHIEEHLKDSTIHTPTEQAFPLKTQN